MANCGKELAWQKPYCTRQNTQKEIPGVFGRQSVSIQAPAVKYATPVSNLSWSLFQLTKGKLLDAVILRV